MVSSIMPSDFESFLGKIKPGVEIVNLGTSHGFDFVSVSNQMTFLNFAKDGNTPYYDLQNFRWLHERGLLDKEAIVIIPVSYFAFGLDENRGDRGQNSGFTNDFYLYLSREQIYDYSLKKAIGFQTFRLQQNVLTALGSSPGFGGVHVDDVAPEAIDRSAVTHERYLELHAKGRVKNHLSMAGFKPETPNQMYYGTLVREAQDNGYRPVLVTVPYTSYYNAGFDSTWLNEHYFDRMHDLSETYGVPYLNYATVRSISADPDLFKDSGHLNQAGKAVFSERFFADLRRVYSMEKILAR